MTAFSWKRKNNFRDVCAQNESIPCEVLTSPNHNQAIINHNYLVVSQCRRCRSSAAVSRLHRAAAHRIQIADRSNQESRQLPWLRRSESGRSGLGRRASGAIGPLLTPGYHRHAPRPPWPSPHPRRAPPRANKSVKQRTARESVTMDFTLRH